MPKEKKKQPTEFKFKGFVNLEFDDQEKETISAWIKTFQPEVNDSVVVLTEAGYKVSFSYSDYHDALQISATCKYVSSKYYGYCFTLVHADPAKGIGILRYLYDSMLSEGLYELSKGKSKYDW